MARGKDIARGLRQAYMAMHRQTQGLLSSHDITSEQYVLLARLSQEDGITQNELTIRASSDPNTVRAMLVLLENKGLVVRKPDETDRRARRIFLTVKGKHLYSKLALVVEPLQDTLLSSLNAQEANQFVACLQRVQEAMRQWELAQPSLSRHNSRGRHETLPVSGTKKKGVLDMDKK